MGAGRMAKSAKMPKCSLATFASLAFTILWHFGHFGTKFFSDGIPMEVDLDCNSGNCQSANVFCGAGYSIADTINTNDLPNGNCYSV